MRKKVWPLSFSDLEKGISPSRVPFSIKFQYILKMRDLRKVLCPQQVLEYVYHLGKYKSYQLFLQRI